MQRSGKEDVRERAPDPTSQRIRGGRRFSMFHRQRGGHSGWGAISREEGAWEGDWVEMKLGQTKESFDSECAGEQGCNLLGERVRTLPLGGLGK